MEAIQVGAEIEKAIAALGEEGTKSKDLIQAKARAMADYDKELGRKVGALRASGTAVSIIDKKAKGETSEMLYKRIVAEESLKAHYSRMGQLEAQLNGLQSLNKHLEYTVH
ncbi:hypothetical protein LCGC14_0376150 [marine sediment metagenome]|uniref:Uncharacterized protein n=1 Tax=marine sediment metagenome TaxID=412755 RepID=A0A0F9TLX8_9ZZZZ